MTGRWRTIVSITATMVFVVGAALSGAQTPKAAKKAAGKKPVVWAADEVKWESLPGSQPTDKAATLWGDPAKGPHGALHKFEPGFSAPLHTHSSDFRVVVISGTIIHGPEGGPERKLPPGSYLFLPSTYKHTTKCDTGSECVVLVDANGKFDVKPVEEKKPAAKK
jgi:quercetin dioxygenase-like cupin family protein